MDDAAHHCRVPSGQPGNARFLHAVREELAASDMPACCCQDDSHKQSFKDVIHACATLYPGKGQVHPTFSTARY
eukprot:3849016-Rhodomonas_salina.1